MAEITNLRQFRKDAGRMKKRAQGDENATKFGRTKAQKILEATQSEKARKMLDQHRIEGEDDGDNEGDNGGDEA